MIKCLKIIFVILTIVCCRSVPKDGLRIESKVTDIVIAKLLDTLPSLKFICSKQISKQDFDTIYIDTILIDPHISKPLNKLLLKGEDSTKFGEFMNENDNYINYKLDLALVRKKYLDKFYVLYGYSRFTNSVGNKNILIAFSSIKYIKDYKLIKFRMQSGGVNPIYSEILFIYDRNNNMIKIVGYEYEI